MVQPFACFGRSLTVGQGDAAEEKTEDAEGGCELPSEKPSPLGPDLKPLVIIARHTGFRSSEQFSLAWKDIDFRNRLITAEDAYTKNGGSRRVPMNEMLTPGAQDY